MGVAGSRIAITGGSIAGSAAAIALARSGCDVTVFERSTGELKDRGTGVAIASQLIDRLVAADFLPADYPVCRLERRLWCHVDGTAEGRLIWDQPGEALLNNWGVLFRKLRSRVDDSAVSYREGTSVDGFEPGDTGVLVRTSAGSQERFDLLIGADGYRSAVRARIHPGTAPVYSGYVLWRGNYDEARVPRSAAIDRLDAAVAVAMIAFPHGHGNLYVIPNFDDRTDRGHRRLTWNIYAPPPPGTDFTAATSLAPGEIDDAMFDDFQKLVDEHYPPDLANLIRLTNRDEISLQPIYDLTVPGYAKDRTLLIGDAGALTRPHTASGATKALADALALADIARTADSLDELMTRYDDQRRDESNEIVEMGRRIGQAQVVETPDWMAMSPGDFQQWAQATLAGKSLYFWGKT
jgi:2-polyprenyl-6-methoxyphenol hydroxylase-like FAD-dependent oxidoreductase